MIDRKVIDDFNRFQSKMGLQNREGAHYRLLHPFDPRALKLAARKDLVTLRNALRTYFKHLLEENPVLRMVYDNHAPGGENPTFPRFL